MFWSDCFSPFIPGLFFPTVERSVSVCHALFSFVPTSLGRHEGSRFFFFYVFGVFSRGSFSSLQASRHHAHVFRLDFFFGLLFMLLFFCWAFSSRSSRVRRFFFFFFFFLFLFSLLFFFFLLLFSLFFFLFFFFSSFSFFLSLFLFASLFHRS